jgi:hypothetical protein
MDGNDHLFGVGKIIGNLHAVEHLLRIFLCEAKGQKLEYPKTGDTHIPETYLTNRWSLEPVIKAYNATLSATEQNYSVDVAIVKLRDAIAHGRLASKSESFPLTLYKFGEPSGGLIPIEEATELDQSWLDEKRALILAQIEKVQQCSNARGYQSIG